MGNFRRDSIEKERQRIWPVPPVPEWIRFHPERCNCSVFDTKLRDYWPMHSVVCQAIEKVDGVGNLFEGKPE